MLIDALGLKVSLCFFRGLTSSGLVYKVYDINDYLKPNKVNKERELIRRTSLFCVLTFSMED